MVVLERCIMIRMDISVINDLEAIRRRFVFMFCFFFW
jgi:hypothetical protein